MDELTLDGETYVSSKRAAKITGYAKDYVGQLCREGRVKARLVGRNWYILETSIREHRFGSAKPENSAVEAKESPVSSWEAPQYASETTPELPVVEKPLVYGAYKPVEAPIEVVTAAFAAPEPASGAVTEEKRDTSELVKEMQSAWQDWFRRKDEEKVVEETLEEVLLEVPGEPVIEPEADIEPDSTPVTLEKIQTAAAEEEKEDEEEESVPIHRSYMVPQKPQLQPKPISVQQPPQRREDEVWPSRGSSRANRVFIREKATGSHVIMRSILISIMFVVIALTIISSGYFDSYFNQATLKYFPFQYLGGERVVNNQ